MLEDMQREYAQYNGLAENLISAMCAADSHGVPSFMAELHKLAEDKGAFFSCGDFLWGEDSRCMSIKWWHSQLRSSGCGEEQLSYLREVCACAQCNGFQSLVVASVEMIHKQAVHAELARNVKLSEELRQELESYFINCTAQHMCSSLMQWKSQQPSFNGPSHLQDSLSELLAASSLTAAMLDTAQETVRLELHGLDLQDALNTWELAHSQRSLVHAVREGCEQKVRRAYSVCPVPPPNVRRLAKSQALVDLLLELDANPLSDTELHAREQAQFKQDELQPDMKKVLGGGTLTPTFGDDDMMANIMNVALPLLHEVLYLELAEEPEFYDDEIPVRNEQLGRLWRPRTCEEYADDDFWQLCQEFDAQQEQNIRVAWSRELQEQPASMSELDPLFWR